MTMMFWDLFRHSMHYKRVFIFIFQKPYCFSRCECLITQWMRICWHSDWTNQLNGRLVLTSSPMLLFPVFTYESWNMSTKALLLVCCQCGLRSNKKPIWILSNEAHCPCNESLEYEATKKQWYENRNCHTPLSLRYNFIVNVLPNWSSTSNGHITIDTGTGTSETKR